DSVEADVAQQPVVVVGPEQPAAPVDEPAAPVAPEPAITAEPEPAAAVRHPDWPEIDYTERKPRSRAWLWLAVPLALFAVGWWVGTRSTAPVARFRSVAAPVQWLRML